MPQHVDPPERSGEFLKFVQAAALRMRADDRAPETLEEWKARRESLRRRLIESWGGFPAEHCALEPRVLETLPRDGYRLEKLLLQTRPGIWMTAHAYVPEGAGRRPAVLCVHGHWRPAKQEPRVQSRCIGLAKLGFFVLAVDAFGAGERAIGKDLGEYHGEMVAATLWPTGLALAGLQAYDNIRAADYLQSRPEVDGSRLGITGASGGGNQTMYAGAVDERFGCVVPVCSVGTYQSYLGAACCMCEVTPGALSYTEESQVLALVAPRALMVINATQDGFQFSVGEAQKSLAAAQPIFNLYGAGARLRHAPFESGHDYSQPMREAMYGWMSLHLKGEGDGSPIAEPPHNTEDPEVIRCFPGDSRPDDFLTLPQFAAKEGRRLISTRMLPSHVEHWRTQEQSLVAGLQRSLGGFPTKSDQAAVWSKEEEGTRHVTFSSEPGVTVKAQVRKGAQEAAQRAIVLDLKQGLGASTGEWADAFLARGCDVIAVELRGTAGAAPKGDSIGRAPDHNSAEWSMWIGRPLAGQWILDLVRLLDVLDEELGRRSTLLVGAGPSGVLALLAAALTMRFDCVAAVGPLASFVTEVPFEAQRLATMVPGLLRDAGDVQHIAAAISPRRLVISSPVEAGGKALTKEELASGFEFTTAAYAVEGASQQLQLTPSSDTAELVSALLS